MIKNVGVILFLLATSACNPLQLATNQDQPDKTQVFTCLTSQSECEVISEHGNFSIQFSGQVEQGRIKTELPFSIQLKFSESQQVHQLKRVSSYLEGKDMFMGKIPVFFKPEQNMSNIMIAETLLANCSEEVMTWRLWFQVDIVVADEIQQHSFFIDFDSQRL